MTREYNVQDTEVKLSQRLLAVAKRLPIDCRLADIGSDHALLPVYAVQQGIALRAIAGEVNEGPLQAARKQIKDANLSGKIETRLGDGLTVLSSEEADVITIAGMGGATIETILEEGLDRLVGVKKLVLQPNVGESTVRRWMHRHHWLLTDETVLVEDGLYYEVLSAAPVQSKSDEEKFRKLYEPLEWSSGLADQQLQLLMGPYLLRKPTAVMVAKWHSEIAKREYVLAQMSQSQSAEAAQKQASLRSETEKIREVLTCLHTGKL